MQEDIRDAQDHVSVSLFVSVFVDVPMSAPVFVSEAVSVSVSLTLGNQVLQHGRPPFGIRER